jgi:DNA-binding GntR family transcriptional regulator
VAEFKSRDGEGIDVMKTRSNVAEIVALPPVARGDRVADQVYRHLRKAIASGEIASGTRLRETEIASALNVSRTPVREAISRLIGDWLVRELGTGGVEVMDVMAEANDIYHIREALELCAVRLAAKRIKPEQLEALDGLIRAMPTASFKDRVRINQEFHLTIAEGSGSRRLLEMIRGFRELFLDQRWVSRQNSDYARRAVEDHKNIVAALRAGSPSRAERILRAHLKLGWDEFQSHPNPD